MMTYATLRNATEGSSYSSGIDDTTPDGHFIFFAKVLGLWRTYLLRGEYDDPHAVIVGQIAESSSGFIAYAGSGIIGSTFLGIPISSEDAFDRILTYTQWTE